MWYKLKMQSVEIALSIASVLAIFASLLCNSFYSILICLLIGAALFCMAAHRPSKFFVKRFGLFFIVAKYPLSKWHNIYQKLISRSGMLHAVQWMDCTILYRELSKQICEMFNYLDTEHGYYRTITHETIINRIKQSEEQGKIKILTLKPLYRRNMVKIQSALLYHKCRFCYGKGTCRFRAISKKKRQFYFIEFYIPERKDEQNGS